MEKRKIIKYKTFSSSEEFEVWQESQSGIGVLNVIPLPESFSFENDEKKAILSCSVFVTYIVET